jgi:hypothetical protein
MTVSESTAGSPFSMSTVSTVIISSPEKYEARRTRRHGTSERWTRRPVRRVRSTEDGSQRAERARRSERCQRSRTTSCSARTGTAGMSSARGELEITTRAVLPESRALT